MDVVELEMDDELFNTPNSKTGTEDGDGLERDSDASEIEAIARRSPSPMKSSHVVHVRHPKLSFRAPLPLAEETASSVASRARAEEVARRSASAGKPEVVGSLMGDDDDSSSSSSDDSDEDGEVERFKERIGVSPAAAAKKPASPDAAPTAVVSAKIAKDARGEDDIEFDLLVDDDDDDAAAAAAPSSGDAAIDAIDAIEARYKAEEASRRATDKLAEKFRDRQMDLDLGLGDLDVDVDVAAAASSAAGADDSDDEFDYAFRGEARTGETHKPSFEAKAMPKELVTDVKKMPLTSFAEEEEEEEEEEETPAKAPATATAAELEEAEQEAAFEEATQKHSALEAAIKVQRAKEVVKKKARGRISVTKGEDAEAEAAAAIVAAAEAKERKAAETRAKEEAAKNPPKKKPLYVKPSTSKKKLGKLTAPPPPDPEPVDEWASANEAFEKAEAMAESRLGQKQKSLSKAPISYADAKAYFDHVDIAEYLPTIVVADEPKCCGGGSKLTDEALKRDRVRMFSVAKMKLDDHDATHLRVLRTVYARLTGASTPAARFGKHWEDVGFQGNDPGTDLRGCGMLGMAQLLMFVDAHASNAGAIYELSRDAAQEFPMAPLSINLTHIALKAVRKGLLNARAKALGSVWKAADQFYVGAFIEFYDRWKEGECTMRDSGFVKAALEEYLLSRKGCKTALKLASERDLRADRGARGKKEEDEEELTFADI